MGALLIERPTTSAGWDGASLSGPVPVMAGDPVAIGSPAEFADGLDPDWGGFRPIWLPVRGNHKYRTAGAAGYREYFHETGGLYWSRKVGSWRVIGLDSEKVASAKQRTWLKATLKKHNGTPTLVMWHGRARFQLGLGDHHRRDAGQRLPDLVTCIARARISAPG